MFLIIFETCFEIVFKEGPHSTLCDEEFYDAVETGLDKIEEENQLRNRLKQKSAPILTTSFTTASSHKLWPEVIISFLFCNFLILSKITKSISNM